LIYWQVKEARFNGIAVADTDIRVALHILVCLMDIRVINCLGKATYFLVLVLVQPKAYLILIEVCKRELYKSN
jgi:hypothetical protein